MTALGRRLGAWGLWPPRNRSVCVRSGAIWAFVAGALAALGQAPYGLWPATLIGAALGIMLWRHAPQTRAAARIGWAFGLGYFLVTLSWLVHPFLVDPARHGWMLPFALFFMCGGLALLWALPFAMAHRLKLGVLGLAGLWGAAELLRGHLFTGFPWGMMGYAWLDTPVALLSSILGPYGLTGLTLAIAALLAVAIDRRAWPIGVLAASAVALLFASGWALGTKPMPQDTEIQLRLVQPNAPQHLKWHPEHIPTFFERALSLSHDPAADLVIWPETALAVPYHVATPYFERIATSAGQAEVIVGLNRVDGMRGYNSAVHLGQDGVPISLYDKQHLVPFGEYLPLPGLMARIGLGAMTAQNGYGYSAGPGVRVMDLGAAGQALPLICYEAIFPRDLRSATRPDWLMQITNDAWFGTRTGPQQSLAQSRFRAIETGLPMVRAANTGVSAIIDARGGLRAAIPLGQSGAVTAPLPGALPQTFYATWREAPAIILFILLGIGGVRQRARATRVKSD